MVTTPQIFDARERKLEIRSAPDDNLMAALHIGEGRDFLHIITDADELEEAMIGWFVRRPDSLERILEDDRLAQIKKEVQ